MIVPEWVNLRGRGSFLRNCPVFKLLFKHSNICLNIKRYSNCYSNLNLLLGIYKPFKTLWHVKLKFVKPCSQ